MDSQQPAAVAVLQLRGSARHVVLRGALPAGVHPYAPAGVCGITMAGLTRHILDAPEHPEHPALVVRAAFDADCRFVAPVFLTVHRPPPVQTDKPGSRR